MFCPGRCFSSTWAARQEEVFMLHSIIKDNLPCSTLRVLQGAQQRASKNCSFSTQIKSWPWNLFSVFYLIVTSKIITKAIMTCFAVGNIPYKDLKNNCALVWRGFFAAMLKVATGKIWKQEQGSLQYLFCYRPSTVGVASKITHSCSCEDDKKQAETTRQENI